MSYGRSSRSDLADDRDFHPRRPAYREHDDIDIYERRQEQRRSPIRRPATAVREYEDDVDIHIRGERERDRVPAFLREDNKRTEAGPLVLRQREVETVDRRKPRSPSPQPIIRERYVERRRSLSPPPRPASRPAVIRPRYVERTPSPPPQQQRDRDVRVDVDTRIIERRRPRSPTPDHDRERIRILMERERAPSPSPSPSPPPPPPPPPVIKGPTIEREVITHYRDIDHGIERARPPTPPPAPRTPRPTRDRDQCETDIDIRRSRGETDIDVRHTHTRSSSRPAPRPRPQSRPSYDDEHVVIRSNDRDRIAVAETTRRRAHSEARRREDWDDEAEYITGKIDARGRMGEAWNGATRDWSIVDVPPGTERVSMDGVGGGSAEVTWQRYNGVRRSKFVPERDGGAPLTSPPMSSTPVSEAPDRDRERLSVQIYDSSNKDRDRGRSRDSDVEIEEIRDKRISIRESSRAPPPKRTSREMWTEITKDLVVREAIEQSGYDYEETEYFFYVMEYLRYEDVVELVNISDEIRRRDRRRRAREVEWEREYRDSWDRHHHHLHAGVSNHGHSHSTGGSRRSIGWDKVDDERIVEREIIYDRPGARYLR
ncbi:hypothetical protein MGN70_013447 [Eutypa lata]|nr:hypothetical protein MGN70_013447 [Eutypa lata]